MPALRVRVCVCAILCMRCASVVLVLGVITCRVLCTGPSLFVLYCAIADVYRLG